MKKFIIILVIVLIGYGGVQWIKMFKANGDFGDRVEAQLSFVSDTSMDSVKQDIVTEAKKFGIDVAPGDVQILYEDTEQRSMAQGIVGSRLDVRFTNKRVTIIVNYVQHILGIPFHENVTRARIRQVEAPRIEPSREMNQLLDAVPQ